MPDEIILRPRTQISYELSRNDPELYRHMLVNSTIERNERSKNLFSWLDKQELFAEDQIEIDISAYDSSSDPSSPRIRFGSGVMPKSEVDKRIYRGERYSYQEQKSYILIHESLHKLFTYVRTNKDHSAHIGLTELFKIAQDIRYEDPYHGLSANGSDRHYVRNSSQSIQAMEDCVELATLWIYEPDLVDEYFKDLHDDRLIEMRTKYGLVDLDTETADRIKTLLSGWMSNTIGSENLG